MMKNKLFLLGILASIAVTLVLPATALAGDLFRFRGDSASAFFSSTDSSGCINTFVGVFASDGRFQAPPGPGNLSSGADVFIDQFDFCTGTSLLSAFGSATLADSDFQVLGKNLNSAILNTTIEVFDFVSNTSFNVVVDLDWTGTGDVSRQNSHSHFQQSPKCKFNSRFNGSFRPAEASGSISANGTNFTPGPSEFAEIQSAKSGDVIIGCN